MERIQPGHEVISLFGMESHSSALNKKIINHGRLIASLISAFFIILTVSLLLNFSTKILGSTSPSIAATSAVEESVAFQPGQFISEKLSHQGYLGSYR